MEQLANENELILLDVTTCVCVIFKLIHTYNTKNEV